MLRLFLLAAVCSVTFGFNWLTIPYASSKISGEYLIELTDVVQSKEQEDAFVSRLRSEFDVKLEKFWHFGPSKILYVKGEHRDVRLVEKLPEVKQVDQNAYAYGAQACLDQLNPQTWGLDRIDQREALPYTNTLNPDARYVWGESTGTGATVYVADSGIQTSHPEFNGRAIWGYTAINMDGDSDLNGHGTHCAGTVGSDAYGVAKDVSLVAVKVLDADASGPWSSIVDGLNWIRNDVLERKERAGGAQPKSVVSMSLGGFCCVGTLTTVVNQLYNDDVLVVAAAMNENDDACDYTPAAIPNAITVGATGIDDRTASFTNYGTCVDIFGPGVAIRSTYPTDSAATMQGTSMATPHVAGVIARYMSSQSGTPSAAAVTSWLLGQATSNAITFRPGHESSPNELLYADCVL